MNVLARHIYISHLNPYISPFLLVPSLLGRSISLLRSISPLASSEADCYTKRVFRHGLFIWTSRTSATSDQSSSINSYYCGTHFLLVIEVMVWTSSWHVATEIISETHVYSENRGFLDPAEEVV